MSNGFALHGHFDPFSHSQNLLPSSLSSEPEPPSTSIELENREEHVYCSEIMRGWSLKVLVTYFAPCGCCGIRPRGEQIGNTIPIQLRKGNPCPLSTVYLKLHHLNYQSDGITSVHSLDFWKGQSQLHDHTDTDIKKYTLNVL